MNNSNAECWLQTIECRACRVYLHTSLTRTRLLNSFFGFYFQCYFTNDWVCRSYRQDSSLKIQQKFVCVTKLEANFLLSLLYSCWSKIWRFVVIRSVFHQIYLIGCVMDLWPLRLAFSVNSCAILIRGLLQQIVTPALMAPANIFSICGK